MSQPSHKGHALRVNVGFLLKETAGYSREILYEADQLEFGDDLFVRDLSGAVQFTRTPEGLLSLGRFRAEADGECVRCLRSAVLPVRADVQELWYYPPEKAPEDAEWVIFEDANLDMAPLVREHFLLGIPIQVLCRPDCRGLCPRCGQDWNLAPCGCTDDPIDPRLAALRILIDDPVKGATADGDH